MKKRLFIIFVFVTVLFVSCGKQYETVSLEWKDSNEITIEKKESTYVYLSTINVIENDRYLITGLFDVENSNEDVCYASIDKAEDENIIIEINPKKNGSSTIRVSYLDKHNNTTVYSPDFIINVNLSDEEKNNIIYNNPNSEEGTLTESVFMINTKTKKAHTTSCRYANKSSEYIEEYTGSSKALIDKGYSPCETCKPW